MVPRSSARPNGANEAERLVRLPDRGLGGRRKRRPERHDEILRAAVRLFHLNGYHATSVEEIAAAVGISATAIYRHYHNKREILDTATLWIHEQLMEKLATADTEDGLPFVGLEHAIAALVDVVLTEPHFIGMFVRDLDSISPDVRAHILIDRKQITDRYCDLLVRCFPGLQAEEARLRIDLVITMICAITSLHPLQEKRTRNLLNEMSVAALSAGDGTTARWTQLKSRSTPRRSPKA